MVRCEKPRGILAMNLAQLNSHDQRGKSITVMFLNIWVLGCYTCYNRYTFSFRGLQYKAATSATSATGLTRVVLTVWDMALCRFCVCVHGISLVVERRFAGRSRIRSSFNLA